MTNKCLFSFVLLLLQNGLLAVPVNIEQTGEGIEVDYEEINYTTPQVTYTGSSVTSPVYTTIMPPYPTTIIAGYPSKPTGDAYPNSNVNSGYLDYTLVDVEIEDEYEVDDDDYDDHKDSKENDGEYKEKVEDYSDEPEVTYKEEHDKKSEYSKDNYDVKVEPEYPKEDDDAKVKEVYETAAHKSDKKAENYNTKPAAVYPTSPKQNNYISNNNGEEDGHWECKWVKVPYYNSKRPSNERYLRRRFKAPMRRVRRTGPSRWPMMKAAHVPTNVPMRRRRSVVYPHTRM